MRLNLTQKILLDHALTPPASLAPGALVHARVDWILASELAWNGMERAYDALGRPPLPRPDRVYLAVDHVVRPGNYDEPKVRALIHKSARFAAERALPHYYGPNETILHTRFFHALGRPGDLVIGADSHTCSHGALGALAIGLGGADVAASMVTGEVWLEVPEVIQVRYEGAPPIGIGGKDVILATLGRLGRNTVARGRVVEYDGPQLSHEARFTVANMTAELGGITGLFPADEVTAADLARREAYQGGRYLRADPGAGYASTHALDLTDLAPQIAKPHSPDAVGPVTDWLGLPFDGAFIGACTTTREALVWAGLLLKAAIEAGEAPVEAPRRVVVPGDLETQALLERAGLAEAYRRAGFTLEAPGCSLCLGLARAAAPGEVWLTSQNRNYRDRIGPGARAFLASATTVAASSLSMRVADPRPWLARIDPARVERILGRSSAAPSIEIHPPRTPEAASAPPEPLDEGAAQGIIEGAAQIFGDHVDTDMIIPGTACHLTDPEDLGARCFEHVIPDFKARCAAGARIVVAGEGWGTGSSREQAAWALAGAGVALIIARSFAFIHRRNLINEGIPHLVMRDARFFEALEAGARLWVDYPRGEVRSGGVIYQAEAPPQRALRLWRGGGLIAELRRSARHHPSSSSACGERASS